MKFEDLMQQSDEKHKRLELEEEILKAELDEERGINKVLHCALHGPVLSHPCLVSLFPSQVQGLLVELAMVEEEIVLLERKVDELKLKLYSEKEQNNKDWRILQKQRKSRQNIHLLPRYELRNWSVIDEDVHRMSRSQHHQEFKDTRTKMRRATVGSIAEMLIMLGTGEENPRRQREVFYKVKPNELSQELTKSLIDIFLDLNKAHQEREGSAIVVPKLISLSCMNSKTSKTQFSCKPSMFPYNQNASNLDPYCIMPDLGSTMRDIGPYKNFVHISRNSIDTTRLSNGTTQLSGKLRSLMQKLAEVELTELSYKEKLAFWINIHNACIMNAFLEHGLPCSEDKLLAILNKATLNVGGIVLNALAIEHFILRHSCEANHGNEDEEELLLRHSYGLGYPEPNVTFALCRGTWSSPALRVYTPSEVVNEVDRAKVEYLEASIGITSNKRKIGVPRLLQLHMRDFADDMDSLLEWIYSQLPHSSPLKNLLMDCLINNANCLKIVSGGFDFHCEYEFRYLLSL